MTQGEELLDAQEIEFLLSAGTDAPAEDTSKDAPDEQMVTMRGDLKQIDLADIFQTLAMSKMEGMLRVRNPLEQREVFFREGLVRCMVPGRVETRRLGELLVAAGLINSEQLRAALLAQRKIRKPIGQILVDDGLVTEDQISEIAYGQITEDLYNLFTWKHGSFEFYRGACIDPLTAQRLENLPELDVNGVLLEVARREDEWVVILEAVRSLDEVPVATSFADAEELDEHHRAVLKAVDGTLNIRELADVTLLGLFDCARVVKDLYEQGRLSPASAEQIIQVAEQWLKQGESKRALVTVQTLYDRAEERTLETIVVVADLLKRCGETRIAGGVLLDAAQQLGQGEDALSLARQARELDPRNPEILTLLQHELKQWGHGKAELIEVTGALVDALRDEGHPEEALAILEDLEELDPDGPGVLSRKARLLHRLKRPEEAVQVLESLAAKFEASKQHEQLVGVYEQILKIDHDRKDIARALKLLRDGKMGRYRRYAMTGGAVLLALALGGWGLHAHNQSRALDELSAQANRHLDGGDTARAAQLFRDWEEAHGVSSKFETLRAAAQSRIDAIEGERASEANRERLARLARAGELLNQGSCVEALAMYKRLLAEAPRELRVQEAMEVRIASLIDYFEKLERDLKYAVPEPPGPLVLEPRLEEILAQMESDFREQDRLATHGVIDAAGDPIFQELVPTEDRTRLVDSARVVAEIFDRAGGRREEYRSRLERKRVSRELAPVFEEAKRYEDDYEYRKALDAYRRLQREYPRTTGVDALAENFDKKVELYSTIIRYLEVIEQATEEGNFAAARNQYRTLRQQYPTRKFPDVRLPVRVETAPPGATVFQDGIEMGRSPLQLAYSPTERTTIRVELAGFQAEEAQLIGDTNDRVVSLLARIPDWTVTLPGSVQHTPVADGDGRVYFVDRSGSVTALDGRTGREVWRFESGDLNGLLPSPAIHGDRLLVASIDGPFRSLDRRTGTLEWSLEALHSEVSPVVCGDVIVSVTTDDELVGIHPVTSEIIYRVKVAGRVQADPVALGKHVFVATTQGSVFKYLGRNGGAVWPQPGTVGRGARTRPTVTSRGLLFPSDDGSLTLLDVNTGAQVWKRGGLGELGSPVTVWGDRIYLAQGTEILMRGLDDGRSLRKREGDSVWTAPPTLVDDLLLAGNRDGQVHVLDRESLAPRFQTRSKGRILAAPLRLSTGVVVIASEDGTVQGFGKFR